jgi:DNA adenine methylase
VKKTNTMTNRPIKPFLKWPGGKFRLLGPLQKTLPSGKRLLEPFVGAGSVFLNTNYATYLVNDLNPDLINLYNLLKEQGLPFIKKAKRYFTDAYNNAEQYYVLRTLFNKTKDPVKRSLLFLYLNRHGFNGLCRYNKKGGFNVPFGRYKKPYFPESEIKHFIERAQRTQFFCLPFEIFLKKARIQDVVYCDPPYVALTKTASFTHYMGVGFDQAAQQRLAAQAKVLASKKIPVIISNHDLPITRQLYQGASQIQSLQVQRSISCKSQDRQSVKELIVTF